MTHSFTYFHFISHLLPESFDVPLIRASGACPPTPPPPHLLRRESLSQLEGLGEAAGGAAALRVRESKVLGVLELSPRVKAESNTPEGSQRSGGLQSLSQFDHLHSSPFAGLPRPQDRQALPGASSKGGSLLLDAGASG